MITEIDLAVRLCEILLAFSLIQQSCEHFLRPHTEKILYGIRGILAALLLIGIQSPYICLGLFIHAIILLRYFQGPYNGGSDRMGIFIIICLTLYHFMPTYELKELAFGYLAIQLILSYVISGWVKIINPQWRNGMALQDVFAFSAYPATESLRAWAEKPKTILMMSWAVIIFELIFPIFLITYETLIIGLMIAATFHLANAYLFGLNRFFWTWIAAYPSIIWLQYRLFDII